MFLVVMLMHPEIGKVIGHIHFQQILALSPAPSRTGS
jgi:hypothetical protein